MFWLWFFDLGVQLREVSTRDLLTAIVLLVTDIAR